LKSFPPLLITSSVSVVASLTALTDRDTRISLTVKSIEQWLRIEKTLRIVICDGSNFDFTEIVSTAFPGAAIECLFFTNDHKSVALHGKGFGEGEIIKYALENSSYLKASNCFAKCTSKLWVDNFPSCLKLWNGVLSFKCTYSNYASIFRLRLERVDTRFYIIRTSLYLECFVSAYLKVRDDDRHYLEHCFRDVILEADLEKAVSPIFPIIEGVSGSSGTRYSKTFWTRFKFVVKRLILKAYSLGL
jgi:hypothetical protein